jgi:riboflavin biosynthesis pyrimidine reductase
LLKEGLVDEISLLMVPSLVGKGHKALFETLDLDAIRSLELIEQKVHTGWVV